MTLKPLDLATASSILDFSGGDPALKNLGQLQLEGAVALHNMIADPKVGMGYLADEVGMGKTYVALGVVSLMRYFNPALRVLYICPSNNVQEKWYSREYRSFSKNNVKVNQYRIRTVDGKPAVPRISCRNVAELIHNASSGYYADFFVGMSSFSIALSDDESQWQAKLDELKMQLPAYTLPKHIRSKGSVKDQYAAALNYVLPTFDLVIIDEAHNFKHDFDSSDRNKVLSAVLGFRERGKIIRRAKHALLLSATPFDRNINHLRNQLKLVGHSQLLPEDIADHDKRSIETHLSRFLVRRLNELHIGGKPYTRNMYRREWRSGEHAEIALESDEQKLVTALVQKKVGEMLDKKGGNPSFQMGLLASFESYAESTKSAPVEFDGEVTEKESKDAKDKHVIGAISDSYTKAGLGRTLPHPKMDTVVKRLALQLFQKGRKQIVFVRRVKSVKELKNKLDDRYNDWLSKHIREELSEHPMERAMMDAIIAEYLNQSRTRDDDISGGEFRTGSAGDTEDKLPPKNDTLFAWFFRGEAPEAVTPLMSAGTDSYTTPEAMRIGLGAKNQVISSLLEINWARALTGLTGFDLQTIPQHALEDMAESASAYTLGTTQNDQLELFQASQLGFLEWYAHQHRTPGLKLLIAHLKPRVPATNRITVSPQRLVDSLETHTVFCALDQAGLQKAIFPQLKTVLSQLIEGSPIKVETLQTLDIHKALISLCLRTGHGAIDLYLARLRQGIANLTPSSRAAWMDDFVGRLANQSKTDAFSTYEELHNLADQLDLVIKTNLPEVYDKEPDEYRKYLSRALNPVAPIIGATGETVSSRSAQARKFRMPGYPLALISTDVFQEGEDLHTFCDSVMHYGLSGSPVSIEQKTGRVDRVGSKAQRRLLSYDGDDDIGDEQLIQVTFPFVRESIEVLQVRQLCHNINEFIRSLHKIGGERIRVQDIISTQEALRDRSTIPDQILTPLQSPYVPTVTRKSDALNREQYVAGQGSQTKNITSHIGRLLQKLFDQTVIGAEGISLRLTDGSERPIAIAFRSARASGEILLCAEIPDAEINLYGMSRKQLHKLMLEKSWHTFHRSYAVETANRQFMLYHDAELLVGDEQSTSPGEIDKFFERFSGSHHPGQYQKPETAKTVQYWSRASREKSARFGQWKAEVSHFKNRRCLGLTFTFGDKTLKRKHRVKIYEAQGRCVFLAQAAAPDIVESLSVDQLVKFTWLRNKHIDLVEFMLDEEGAIVGRAVHPIDGMTYKEFMYCAYTLAASTDRLEYLIQVPDIH